MTDEVYNAADEELVHAHETKRKNVRSQEVEDLRDVLRTPQGTRVMRKIMSDAKLFQTSFTGSSQTFFNEGWRAFGLKILGDVVEAAPNKLNEILIEKKEEVSK